MSVLQQDGAVVEQTLMTFEQTVEALPNSKKLKAYLLSLDRSIAENIIASGESMLNDLDSTLNEG